MNTKAVKSFGLALMLAAGVLAVLLALGTFSPQKVAGQASGIDATVQPSTAAGGAATPLRVNFAAGSDGIISGQTITVTLASFGVPVSIDAANVAIRAGDATGRPTSVETDPKKGTISFDLGNDTDGVPMDIAAGSEIALNSITFAKAAGITAPTASGVYDVTVDAGGGTASTSGGTRFTVNRSAGTDESPIISPADGDRDTVITVSGTGFGDGTVSIYVLDAATTDPESATIADIDPIATAKVSGGAFTKDIEITVGDGDNEFQNGSDNFVHVIDPRTQTSASDIDDPSTEVNGTVVSQAFTLTGKVTITDGTTLVLGVTDVEVALEDAATTVGIEEVTIDGVAVPFGGAESTKDTRTPTGVGGETVTTDGDGAVTLKFDVPNTLDANDEGKLSLNTGTGDDATVRGSTAVVVKAIDLAINPAEAVQGNTVSLSGSGFGSGVVAELSVGGEDVDIAEDTKSVAGSYLFTFEVPDADHGEEVEVKLTQDDGKVGTGTIIIKKPTIEVSPPEGRVGTTIVVTGTGFPANDQVIITYGGPSEATTASVAHVVDRQLTDAAGDFNASFNVPANAGTSSTGNIVQAFRPALDPNVDRESNEAKHNVPGPTVTIEPKKGQAGETVTVTGLYHRSNASVEVHIGTDKVSADGARADAGGDFVVEAAIPDNQGQFPVLKLEVDGEIPAGGTAIIEVLPAPEVEPTRDVATEFADLIEAGVLDSVFRYNDDKSWSGYSPAAPAEANDLDTVNSGDFLWIKVSADGESYGGKDLTTTPNPWTLVAAP